MTPYYSHAGITIFHGDCREVLPSIGPVDLVLTDPPYGVNFEYESFEDSTDSVSSIIHAIWPELEKAKRIVLTPGIKNMFAYPQPLHVGSFYYPAGAGCNSWGFTCWQPIFYYGKDPHGGKGSKPDSFTSTEAAEKNGHPCPKPIRQWKWLTARVSVAGETVLDPFMGSGTTMVAARDLGLVGIGIEIEERYCEIAAKRLSQEVMDFGDSEVRTKIRTVESAFGSKEIVS